MKRRKKQTTVYLEDHQLQGLYLLSDATKIPMAALIREGMDLVLSKYKKDQVQHEIHETGKQGLPERPVQVEQPTDEEAIPTLRLAGEDGALRGLQSRHQEGQVQGDGLQDNDALPEQTHGLTGKVEPDGDRGQGP